MYRKFPGKKYCFHHGLIWTRPKYPFDLPFYDSYFSEFNAFLFKFHVQYGMLFILTNEKLQYANQEKYQRI